MSIESLHKPVMRQEALKALNLKPGQTIVDATVGTAGHSLEILKAISPGGRLIGIDRDEDSLVIAKERLAEFNSQIGGSTALTTGGSTALTTGGSTARFTTGGPARPTIDIAHGDFRDINKILNGLKVKKIDGILFDLGVSSYQLDSKERGFSFRYDAPLDMRMDKTSYILAYDLVNNLTEKEISDILWMFGEERWHNRIARYLVRERSHSPVATTGQLRDIVLRAIGRPFSPGQRIHPATRTFQALRIAVNRELEALEEALRAVPELLKKNGRVCVISFHSLEDRIVKHNFKENSLKGIYRIITKKPLEAGDDETAQNPRSRSAKMRAASKI
ncbi:MAG: 16S rRNA (cytosine(1402)-N(4))-methyltransferase [Omnitrophica WOR_2 bacterium RIFOXYA2_FULL_45_12]|nr:MAG: 16S rRNA (cytosine(1402)-N(4))-methyltransferase [Omnitrophica WOR_2 bacterium RIFOXYA2_FULL_45_12]